MFELNYIPGRDLFKEFATMRESLIYQYKKGDLSKKEYIRESLNLLLHLEASPFRNVDSFEKAVFNYHYYNTMAKYMGLKAVELRKMQKHQDQYRQIIKRKDQYYHQKDVMSWKAVNIVNFAGVKAYGIKVASTFLKNDLFEIVFDDYPTVVFHSRSKWLKEKLEKERIFECQMRRSIIETYVNERY